MLVSIHTANISYPRWRMSMTAATNHTTPQLSLLSLCDSFISYPICNTVPLLLYILYKHPHLVFNFPLNENCIQHNVFGIVLSAHMCKMWIIWLISGLKGEILKVGKRNWFIYSSCRHAFVSFVTALLYALSFLVHMLIN